ncbi:MAG TPA: acyltransferase family protein [Solirubrobacteraceae bacterium]|jgi:peptidoglycan/LPS O-acetylase OafA/YrhL
MRSEIQALRGIAVLAVVVYHLWPDALPGGFVGVDVFFVISGFLITGQLAREVDRTGRLSLSGFWARRARRILPAALVVLAFCALATKAIVPETRWGQFFGEITASTAYVENWQLADVAVDYQAADDAPSPVRHFWSLSVEEQFYVVWPLLVLLALAAARRRIGLVLGAVTAASFAWSLHKTATDPAAAYFVTPARAWEFGVGGLLALAGGRRGPRVAAVWRRGASVAGLAAIAAACLAFDAGTAFPGIAALLPVLGATAVIAGRSLAFRPLEAIGDISYSVYLWHWPLIVLWPAADRVVLLAVTLALAWLSKAAIEDPIRRVRVRPALVFGPAAACTAAVLLLASAGAAALDERVERDQVAMQRVLAKRPPCFGAAAVARRCRSPRTVVPTPIVAQDAPNAPCSPQAREGLLLPCVFGTPRQRARREIAIVGDSHASHWRAALRPVAKRNGWRGTSLARAHCPLAAGDPHLPEPDRSGCLRFREQVPRYLARHPEIDTLFVAQWVGAAATAEDYAAAWDALPVSIERVVVIRDTPEMLPESGTLACVEEALDDGRAPASACARPRDEALRDDPAARAAQRSGRAVVVDLIEFFCDARTCPPVIGGALVYKDTNHITAVYGATLAPYLRRAIDRATACATCSAVASHSGGASVQSAPSDGSRMPSSTQVCRPSRTCIATL